MVDSGVNDYNCECLLYHLPTSVFPVLGRRELILGLSILRL